MCGIAGFTQFSHSYSSPETLLETMGNTIAHRGPDDSDVYTDSEIGLCHRRLAIIDLTESGRQPMRSPTGLNWKKKASVSGVPQTLRSCSHFTKNTVRRV